MKSTRGRLLAAGLFQILLASVVVGGLEAQLIRKRVPASSFETVTIVYTANIRSRDAEALADAPASSLLTMLNGIRREYSNILLIDLGNFSGPTPPSLLTQGRFDFAMMERLGYDLLHVSSDDFAIGAENLQERISQSAVPVVSGNLEGNRPLGLEWTVLPCGNRKVGFIGVTTTNFPYLVLANQRRGVTVRPIADSIAQAVKAMEGKADIVVALTDLNEDEVALIRSVPGLDLILTSGGNAVKDGADWISVGFPGTRRAAIARVLSTGTAVHVLEIHGYPTGNKWTIDELVGEVYPVTEDTPRDATTALWVKEQLDSIKRIHNEPLGTLLAPLSNDDGKNRQTPLGQAVADLLRSQTKAHLAFVDAGSLQKGLAAGPVTEWDLLEALPYPDPVVVVKLTGEQITAVLARAKRKLGEDGYLQVSNLVTEPKALGNRIGGLKLVADRTYLVALPEFLAQGGDNYEELGAAPVVQRTGYTVAELCRRAFSRYGTIVPLDLPMDEESHFWYSRLRLSTSAEGFVADPQTFLLYPDQVTMARLQVVASSLEARWDLIRTDRLSVFENFVEAQYGLWWDQDWVPSQTMDNLLVGSQITALLSNYLFGGDRIADPYLSALLETALVFPDPTEVMFVSGAPRPGTLKLGAGLAAPTLLRPVSVKLGIRWEDQPFSPKHRPSTGLDGVVALQTELIEDVLSIDSTTEVFSSLDSPNQGVSISSVNQVLFTVKTNLSVGPRVRLFFNSLVGHWAYLFDLSLMLNLTFQ